MTALVELAYLLAAAFFILGLKRLASPATARNGNRLASSRFWISGSSASPAS